MMSQFGSRTSQNLRVWILEPRKRRDGLVIDRSSPEGHGHDDDAHF